MLLVLERDMDPGLDARLRDCLCACFPADREVFSRTRAWHGCAPSFSAVEERAGLVLGQVGVVRRRIRAGLREVEVAGIQNVAVRPEARGTGLGPALLAEAMRRAAGEGIPYGLLFCLPGLGEYYRRQGWRTGPASALMEWEGRRGVPIPDKNICMTLELAGQPFPEGDIDLLGADW